MDKDKKPTVSGTLKENFGYPRPAPKPEKKKKGKGKVSDTE